jgi:hypothetical protein
MRHCPVTGQPIMTCSCGACDELDPYGGGDEDGSDEDD